ncbi:ABC transporter substrate-binding protein [Streptomyces sp. NPDC048441]|uniref:ABC transporter substrate-binding protein n=1 Tax=Streptomyces sp. NPDC048441 TaxID=3365552 RepID=UPI003716F5EC
MNQRLPVPRPPINKLLVVSVVLVLLAAAGYGGYQIYWHQHWCADGISKESGGECVGVTDGGFRFPGLADISKQIERQNQKVGEVDEHTVTIAHLESMSGGTEDRGPEGTRQAIAGAHIAQLTLNAERRTVPRVRLLLANTGKGDKYADQVVDQLLELKDEQHLVAVTGIGQSNENTRAAVRKLRDAGVATIGATVAANELSAVRKPGFFRVSFPANAQAAAAVRHLKEEQDGSDDYRVDVVRDSKVGDIYDASLYTGFRSAAERMNLKVHDVIPFTSGAATGEGNALRVAAQKVCEGGDRPKAVYFAGRGRELRSFIEAVGETRRHCPVTVLSGSSAVGVYFDTSHGGSEEELAELDRRWKASGMKVSYTAYTHPEASKKIYGGLKNNPYSDFERRYQEVGGGTPDTLNNGQAMVGYDALYAAGVAARHAVDTYGDRQVTAAKELDLLGQTNGSFEVRGVSGKIAFDPDTGEPTGRPMALVELKPPGQGGGTDGSRYHFVDTLAP